MAADLDRAYVINGDDLRIALAELAGKPIVPGDAARSILSEYARPLREPHATGPRLHDADLCARCGNQFKPGQVCDSCRALAADPWAPDDDVVDAHIHCEHVPGDGEVAVLATVKRELDRLCLKPEGTIRRVLAYLADTYGYVLADED